MSDTELQHRFNVFVMSSPEDYHMVSLRLLVYTLG